MPFWSLSSHCFSKEDDDMINAITKSPIKTSRTATFYFRHCYNDNGYLIDKKEHKMIADLDIHWSKENNQWIVNVTNNHTCNDHTIYVFVNGYPREYGYSNKSNSLMNVIIYEICHKLKYFDTVASKN